MDREQKFKQTQQIEQYLKDNQIRELFLDLVKQLIVVKPDKPLDFLIDKLYNPLVKRIFVLGPSGSFRKDFVQRVKDQFGLTVIETSDLLKKEVSKESAQGSIIKKAMASQQYVPDEIVIEIVKKRIVECEKECRHWIIEGFPRTKSQALAMEKIGIIPDKMIELKVSEEQQMNKIRQNIIDGNVQLSNEAECDKIAKTAFQEYHLKMKGLREVFGKFLFVVDCQGKLQHQIETNLIRMISLKFNKNSPRKPPGIILLGPPGSGRSTQGKLMADQFGLINVSVRELVKEKMKETADLSQIIKSSMVAGKRLPDEIVNTLIAERLESPDCKVNGWIIEGFPMNEAQYNLLKTMKVKPSCTIILEQDEKECIARLKDRRLDPVTGKFYNIRLIKLDDPALTNQLKDAKDDDNMDKIKKLGFAGIDNEITDILSLGLNDAKTVNLDILKRLKITQEDQAETVTRRYKSFQNSVGVIEELLADSVVVQSTTDLSIPKLFEEIASKIQSA